MDDHDQYNGCMSRSTFSEQVALVALLRERPNGLKWADITALVRDAGSAVTARDDLRCDGLFLDPVADEFGQAADREVTAWLADGLEFLTIVDPRYPQAVRDIHEAPPFLFARGEVRVDDPGLSVVGSRDASAMGLKMAASIATALVGERLSVISGLAAGIDTAAHEAALAAGGRPVGVIGTGIRRTYPAANFDLHRRVAENGVLLSQFLPDAPPQKHTFLMRNATMSGYGLATVVVEAGEHSGARSQARMAVEHGRPVILTDLVVAKTDWAKALIDRPGVYVASSTSEVIDVIRRVRSADDRVEASLRDLVLA